MKRFLLIILSLGLFLAACDGGFDDEYYDDFEDEEGWLEDEEGWDDEEGEYEDEYEEADVVDEGGEETAVNAPLVTSDAFVAADCPLDVPNRYGVTCGYLTVPENRASGSGATIELAIAILPAQQANREPDPVIYLDGGPGGSALSSLEAEPDAWAEYGFAQNRDTIFIDQRGTGYSEPSLNCPEMDDDEVGLDHELDCLARLEGEGIDLSGYNTAENAADVADLADALGLESYNLVGISYGTRLALAVMRDHPAKVRSVVLDSPFPPNADPATDEAYLTYDRILALIDLCNGDSECGEYYPDLDAILRETVERMNTEPPTDDLDGDVLLQTIYQALFSADQYASAVPLMIYTSYEEDYSLLEDLSAELLGGYRRVWQSENDGDSEGMYTSVMCHDEFAFSTAAQAEARTENAVPVELAWSLAAASLEFFELCEEWGAGEAAAWANAAVVSDIPTLVLVGELDPATPPVWGQLAVETLSNGVLYVVPGNGHSLLSTNNCAISLSDQFIADPFGGLDDGCMNQQPAIQFEY